MKFRVIISLLISALFLWLAGREVNFSVVFQNLDKFNYLLLFFALVIWHLGYVLRGFRWQYQLKDLNPVTWWNSFRVLIAGFGLNNVLPMRIGEFARAYLMHRVDHKIPSGSAFATIAIERILDGFCVVGFTFIGTLGIAMPDWVRSTEIIGGLMFLLAFVSFILLVNHPDKIGWVVAVLNMGLPDKWAVRIGKMIESFIKGLSSLRSLKKTLVIFGFTALAWTIEVFYYYLSAKSFGIELNLFRAAFLMGIVNLGAMIPAGPGGVGAFELIAVKALALFGIDQSIAFSYGVIGHLMQNVSIALLAFYFLWQMGVHRLSQVMEKSPH